MTLSSKNKAITALVVVMISAALLWFEQLGVVPFLTLIIGFFTFIIQVTLHIMGYHNGDVFEAYQDAERTEATALTNLIKNKKDCEKR
ncbi:hypothetical protein L1D61_17320 [Vibrio mediterranei]|nr:hypothetical protein [Vibrio mediterranei]